jgi:hypothetical protein
MTNLTPDQLNNELTEEEVNLILEEINKVATVPLKAS